MGTVRLGISMISWAIMAVLIGVGALVVLAVASIVASVVTGSSADYVTALFGVVPFVVLGASALGFVGKLLCLKAPVEAGQSALIGSVLCSVTRVVLMFLGTRALADAADLAGVVLLLLFVGGLATHVRRNDLTERITFAMWLLVGATAGGVMVAFAPAMAILQWGVLVVAFALVWSVLRGLDGALAELSPGPTSGSAGE